MSKNTQPLPNSFQYLLFLLVLLLVVLMAGCSHIEDSNGSDPSLATLTYEELTNHTTGLVASRISRSSTKTRRTVTGYYDDIDIDSFTMSSGKSSGIQDIMAVQPEPGGSVVIRCDNTVQSGNLAIVLLSPERKILYEFTIGTKDSCTLSECDPGVYLIRIGCESFKGKITLIREFPDQ